MAEEKKEMTMEELKNKATLLGLTFKGNISREALEKLVLDAALSRALTVGSEIIEPEEDLYETDHETFTRTKLSKKDIDELRYQALLMLKVRITNLNPEEASQSTVYAGVVTPFVRAARYIPFDKVWYVEQCLIDKLMVDKTQAFIDEIDPKTRKPNGNKKSKMVKHYNIEFVK
jgi:hypothetical protein